MICTKREVVMRYRGLKFVRHSKHRTDRQMERELSLRGYCVAYGHKFNNYAAI